MRRILFDTSAYSAFRNRQADLLDVVQQAEVIYLTPIVVGELIAGFRRGTRFESNLREFQEFLAAPPVSIVAIDEETAEFYALILADLLSRGRPIPTNDVWIAASAMQHGLSVVTTDRHFENVSQIRTLVVAT